MIHVCFVLHDKTGHYSKFTGTAMLSIFQNIATPPPIPSITVHILHDDTLTQDNRDKFQCLADSYGQLVKFYNVEELCADKINKYVELVPSVKNARVSRGAFFKFCIPEVLDADIEKVIYLDSDIIVNLDITELWQIELDDHPLAVVENFFLLTTDPLKISDLLRDGFVKVEDYFNSGMMVMNLPVFRNEEDNILSGIKFRGEHPQYVLWDQEILNYCFSTRTLKLPGTFNSLVLHMREYGIFTVKDEIYHYAAGEYTLGLDMSDPFNRLWWSYFIKTPWFDVDTIDKIFKRAANYMSQLPVVSPDKTRAFIVDEEHACQIEKNFSVRDAEEVIVVDNESEESLERLTKLISDSKGKKIFFIGIPNIDKKLLEMRFVRGKDFFNISGFYSPIWMNRTNNYNLILSM